MELKTFFDFCSGIGAGRLGLEQSGLKCVGFSDTSRLAETTYRLLHNTEGEKNYGNLRKIKSEDLPDFDVLIAGFPCQSFSVIGRQEGFNDIRGQIIFHLARFIKEKQPKAFILENVKGLVTHDNGKTIETIVNLLKEQDYNVFYKVLISSDYRVPQMRQRVYFIGIKHGLIKEPKSYFWPKTVPMNSLDTVLCKDMKITPENLNSFTYYLKNPTNKGKYSVDDILNMEGKIIDTRMSDLRIYTGRVPTLRAQRDGVLYVKNHELYQLTGYEALMVQGFPKEYADKVKDKVSDRHLLMQAGNAMTVNVINHLGNSLVEFFKGV